MPFELFHLTAKSNGRDPLAYLTDVLKRMPCAHTMAEIEQLLPWNLGAPAAAH